MKPFNKERALAGDPVCTLDKLRVEVVGTNQYGGVFGRIYTGVNNYVTDSWFDDGRSIRSKIENQIFMMEEEDFIKKDLCKCKEQSIEELKQKIITLEKALCRVECEKQKLYDEYNVLAEVEKAHQEMVARLIKER